MSSAGAQIRRPAGPHRLPESRMRNSPGRVRGLREEDATTRSSLAESLSVVATSEATVKAECAGVDDVLTACLGEYSARFGTERDQRSAARAATRALQWAIAQAALLSHGMRSGVK